MKIVLMKFGAAWCQPCQQLAKRQTLEKFAEKHSDVRVAVHDDTMNGSTAYERLANEWGIKNIPTLIWTSGGKELLRSYDVSSAGIEAQYQRALRKVA